MMQHRYRYREAEIIFTHVGSPASIVVDGSVFNVAPRMLKDDTAWQRWLEQQVDALHKTFQDIAEAEMEVDRLKRVVFDLATGWGVAEKLHVA